MKNSFPNSNIQIPMMDLYIKPADHLFPLTKGTELFIDAPDADEIKEMQFVFGVAFGEKNVAEGAPLLNTLKDMVNLVDGISADFKPMLS